MSGKRARPGDRRTRQSPFDRAASLFDLYRVRLSLSLSLSLCVFLVLVNVQNPTPPRHPHRSRVARPLPRSLPRPQRRLLDRLHRLVAHLLIGSDIGPTHWNPPRPSHHPPASPLAALYIYFYAAN